TSAPMTSSSSVATSTSIFGRRKTVTAKSTAMPNLPSLTRLPAKPAETRDFGALVSAFESETQAVLYRTTSRRQNTILYVLVAMMAATIAFITFFKLDVVVTGLGITEAVDGSVYVDPLDKGVVREILVKAGQLVKKGDVLATMDPTF